MAHGRSGQSERGIATKRNETRRDGAGVGEGSFLGEEGTGDGEGQLLSHGHIPAVYYTTHHGTFITTCRRRIPW